MNSILGSILPYYSSRQIRKKRNLGAWKVGEFPYVPIVFLPEPMFALRNVSLYGGGAAL